MIDAVIAMSAPVLVRRPSRSAGSAPVWVYYPLFFVSGFPALLYQIVWQRALFTIYGVNIESVTIIVTVFMLGLGLGSLLGGKLSTVPSLPLLRAFGLIELGIGLFGAVSLPVFHRAATVTAGASILATAAITFALLFIPTLLMGGTLPLLVKHLTRHTGNVGESVGLLYAVNTLGSASACFAAALLIMRSLGESGSVVLAALLNALVGTTALVLHYRWGLTSTPLSAEVPQRAQGHSTVPLGFGLFLAGAFGFISLGYEVLWYRLYAFVSGGAAPSFAYLLAFYLSGIGYGSLVVRGICRRDLQNDLRRTMELAASTVLYGSVAGFLLGPALAFSVRYVPYNVTFALVFLSAALLGAAFPFLSHAVIKPHEEVGSRLSLLYLADIIGSALGSFLVGFVLMEHWSTRSTSLLLLTIGAMAAVFLQFLARPIRLRPFWVVSLIASAVLFMLSQPLFSSLYERLLCKQTYTPGMVFRTLVENRSGVIAVDKDDTVFGGGVYDGRFNVDPTHDRNGIFRAYAIAGLHPKPQEVLIIGLSSGSWAQVLANHPEVKGVTIVEINPGYFELIAKHANVASLLRNPKVHFVVDDGRRWLVSHPDRKFDFILMNTTFHWRAHATNLLSTEFLRLIRQHLKPGGIQYYNTTSSPEAQQTGSTEFPYALRVSNFLAVSDSPITLDKRLWRSILAKYKIDGRPVFDVGNEGARKQLETLVGLADRFQVDQSEPPDFTIESRMNMLGRLGNARLITDDNMGTEWQ